MAYPTFASGDVLTATDMNNVGWWKITSQTIGTGVSSVPVTGVFSSSYQNYRIMVTGGTGSAFLELRMTLGATATGYYWSRNGWTYANPGVANAIGAANSTSWTVGNASNSPAFINAIIDIYSPNVAANTVFTGQFALPSTTGYSGMTAGYLADTNQYTAFTISTSAGTLTGGTIKVYGWRD